MCQHKHLVVRHELDRQVAIKRERALMRKQQDEIERNLQQQTDEIVKKSDENAQKIKKLAIQQQKEFLLV